jgi:predicted permease
VPRGLISDEPEPERVEVLQFTEGYLPMHGVLPVLGRAFTVADTQIGAPDVVLLSHGYWQRRFGGRSDVVGEVIRSNEGVATIVGVLPTGFNADVHLSRPLRIPAEEMAMRGTGRLSVYGRLRPGVSLEQAAERLSARTPDAILPNGEALTGESRAVVASRLEMAVGRYRTTANVLAGAVGLILLIACVNVGGLQLARGAARQAELAVRASLGAGRLRLMRQLLTESLVLAVVGGVLGIVLAWASLGVLVASLPLSLPQNTSATINVPVLTAIAALLIPTTLLFGLVPAIRLSRVHLAGSTLARGARLPSVSLSRRGGQVLIGVEIALAVVLVVGAGLMVRSLARLSAVDLGLNPDGLITMEVLPLDEEPAAHKAYFRELLQRVRVIPGVESAGLVDFFSLGDGTRYTPLVSTSEPVPSMVFDVAPGYFETIEARLREGRFLTEADVASGFRGIVVNETAARTLFPEGPAVGRQVTRATRDENEPWTILGVVADLRHGGPLNNRSENFPQAFFPYEPTGGAARNQAMVVVLRSSNPVPDLANRLRQAAQAVGPGALVEGVRPAQDWFGDRIVTPRRRTVLLGLLGGLGLALAVVGVFGMTAYAVARRTGEIGVRMAFGARPGQVVRVIVGDALMPIAIGTAAGLGTAALATRAIESFLFQTPPTDLATFIAVALILVGAGILAALAPALRATRVDPVQVLRAD